MHMDGKAKELNFSYALAVDILGLSYALAVDILGLRYILGFFGFT